MTWLAAWAFIKKVFTAVPWWVWLTAAIMLAFYLYGENRYAAGQAERQGLWDAATAETNRQIDDLKAQAGQVVTKVEYRTVTKTVEVKVKGDTIIKKVPIYVPTDTPDLPAGMRLLHDAAALQTDLADSSTIASSDPVPAATFAATVVGNYTACHINAVRLEGWQLWWAGIEQACKRNGNCELMESPDAHVP